MKNLFEKIFLILIFPSIILIGLELICRVFKLDISTQQAIQLEMPTWMQLDENSKNKTTIIANNKKDYAWLYQFEEGQGYRVHLKPNINSVFANNFNLIKNDPLRNYSVKSNSQGFRGTEFIKDRTSNTFRILIFGDSSSFGWGVNQEDIFSELIKKDLQNKFQDKKIEVFNFAIPGDSSAYGRLIFNTYVKDYQPDFVILGFGANDSKLVLQAHDQQIKKYKANSKLLNIKSILSKSALFRSMIRLSRHLQPKTKKQNIQDTHKSPAVKIAKYKKNLRYMANSKIYNSLILNLCTPGHYAKAARKVAEKINARYLNGQQLLIDLLPQIKNKEIYPEIISEMEEKYSKDLARNDLYYITSDACHPNKLGHRIIADYLTKEIYNSSK